MIRRLLEDYWEAWSEAMLLLHRLHDGGFQIWLRRKDHILEGSRGGNQEILCRFPYHYGITASSASTNDALKKPPTDKRIRTTPNPPTALTNASPRYRLH